MSLDDRILSDELEDAQIHALPFHALQQRTRELVNKLRLLINSDSDINPDDLLVDAINNSTAYSLDPIVEADSIDIRTKLYSYPLISSQAQARAFLGHFFHTYINTVHQELRLIALRLVSVISSEEEVPVFEQELSVRITALHRALRDATTTYSKLVPLVYSPSLANQSHRFTDPLVLDPQIPLSSTQLGSQHDTESSTFQRHDHEGSVPLTLSDYALPLGAMTRCPDLYDELEPRIGSLDRSRTGEIIRRGMVSLERYLTTTHSQFHCDYPYLYTAMAQLQNSLVALGDSYSVLLDPLREATEFVSRSTKLVTSSVDKLIRFFAVAQRKPCDTNCGLESVSHSAVIKDIGIGSTSPIAIIDSLGYERVAKLNPRYHNPADIQQSGTSSDLRLRYRNTYTVAGKELDKLTEAEREANDSTRVKLATFLNAPFSDAMSTTDSEKQKQTQCSRISASPLLIIDYVYRFVAGSNSTSLRPTNCTSAAGTSDDIFRILTAGEGHNKKNNRDTDNSSIAPPTARTKLSSCLPGHGMPIFTHSLDVDAADARVKAGPAALPVDAQLFNSKSLVIDEALMHDLNLTKAAFIDVEDYYRMKLDNFDSSTGDIIAAVNRHISARVKAHIAYANAGLPANLLHLHYYMIYGKIVHIRARLLYHYNHLEYVRCKMDSDLHLHTLDFPFERTDKQFSPQDIGDTFREIMSKDTPAGSGTGIYGVLGFRRDDSLTERSSLKANDILAPDKSRIIFAEAMRQLSDVIERDILYAGSTLIEYLSSDAAENRVESSKFGNDAFRVDRMVILLFLYEQELNLVERKRQVADQALKCYFHSVNYADCVKWIQYVSGIIDLRPSYDAHLLAATNDINSFTGCQALVLRLQQVSRFIDEYITAVLEDDCREVTATKVHSHIERKLVNTSLPPASTSQKVVSDAAPWRGSASQRHSSAGSRRGSSAFQHVGSRLGTSQSGNRPTSALASRTSKYMGDDHRDSSFISERSSVDGFSRKEGPKRALLLSGHTEVSDDHPHKRTDAGRTASVVTKDSYVITFPRYSCFGSPTHSAFANTTICDIHFSIGKVINFLSDLDKYAHIFTSKYLFSPKLPAYANDLCHCAVYEAAREELFFVAQSRYTRGALGTLPQYLHKQCRYGLYGFPYELVQSVKTIAQANDCLNILACKRNLALLTIQTTVAVQCLGSCYNELGRRLSKLSIGRGPWTNSCLEDMLPNFINFEEFLTSDKHELPRAKSNGARHVPDICKETETDYDYSKCLTDFSNRDFTSTFDSFQLPSDFDFELCLFDPLAGAAIRLLREITPTVFKVDPLFLDGNMGDLLEAALPDVIVSDDSSEEEFILTTNSKSTLRNNINLTEKHLLAASARVPCGPGSAIDLSYKSYHPYAHIPNFLSPSTVSDITGTLNGFSYCSTLFSITTEHRKDGFLDASHSNLTQISKKYQSELSSIVDILINRGPEKMGPRVMSPQDSFEANPYIYLDNVVGFIQRLVFVQACGLEYYRTILNELIETIMVPLRNLNTACELKTRYILRTQNVDISSVSAVVLLDNVPESTSFFITQQYAELRGNDVVSKGAIPLGKEPQESALNRYTANDCFLSFLILAAEYKYIWSNEIYIKARSSYAELQDKLSSGVVGSLLMFERARCIESVLLTHKDRLMALKRAHIQIDHDRDSLTTSDTTRSARSSSHVSTGTLEDVSDLPFYLRIDLRNMELVTIMLMLCDHSRAHSLRSQLADILNSLRKKHKEMYLCEVENILIRQESDNQSDWSAYINKVDDCTAASMEQQSLEFLSEFKIIDNADNWKINIIQSLGRYLPNAAAETKESENVKGKANTKPYKASNRHKKHDVTNIYDILCISPYLLDPLVHENISSLLFGHKPDTLTKAPVSQSIVPNLTILPSAPSVRFIMASKTTSLFQAVPFLAGLIHLYSSYLHYFDFSLVLQKLSCRLAMSGHELHDEKDFDAQVHDLLLNDSSSGFIRRANGYSDFILKMALSSQIDEKSQNGGDCMQGCITRVQGDGDDSSDTSLDTSLDTSESSTPPDNKTANLVHSEIDSRKQALVSASGHSVQNDHDTRSGNEDLEALLPNSDFELDGYGEKIDNLLVQRETKQLLGQLRLVSNSKALDFKIRGYKCKNNMLIYFARLMSLVMNSIWKQCKSNVKAKYMPRGNSTVSIKEANKTIGIVDFNKYAASLGLLDGIAERSAKYQYNQQDDEYASSDPRILEYMSSKKVLELQEMPITPLNESIENSDDQSSQANSDSNEDQDLFLPEMGENILLTSYTFVEVLKVVYIMRDFAFERIMGYALLCLKSSYSHGDFISTDSLLETFENVKRVTGFDITISNPINKIIDTILGRLKPSGGNNGLPGIFEDNVINERTMTLLAHRGNEYAASGMDMTEESRQVRQRESSDTLLKNGQPSDVYGAEDDTLRTTKRISLDLLEQSIPEPHSDYIQHENQTDLLQSVTGAGLKLNLKALKTCGEHTDLFRPKILNRKSSFSSKLILNRFVELTYLSAISLPFLDGLFNGLCSGYRFGSSLSCFDGYIPFTSNLDQNGQSTRSLINLNCSTTNLGHHLMHMGLNPITPNQPLTKDTVSHRASGSFRSTSARSSTTLNEASFAEIFGVMGHHSMSLDQCTLDGGENRMDASVMHIYIFLQQLRERNYLHTYGKREPQFLNRHITYHFSDFFLLSERISPIVLHSAEKVLGIDTIDEYSEFCALSECGKSVVMKTYADIFDPVFRSLTNERAGLTEPPKTKCVIVGKLKLFQSYNLLNCLTIRLPSASKCSVLGDNYHDNSHDHLSPNTPLKRRLAEHRWLSFLPEYTDTVLSYHTNPTVEPWINSNRLSMNIFLLVGYVYNQLSEALITGLEDLIEKIKLYVPSNPSDNFITANRFFKNPAPIYPLVPGIYGLSPADVTLPYLPGDSMQSTRFLHRYFGRNFITIEALSNGVASSGENQNLVVLTNYALAQMLDKFKSILFSEMTQRVKLKLQASLLPCLGMRANLFSMTVNNTEANQALVKILTSIPAAVSSYSAARLHALQSRLSSLRLLNTSIVREASLLPTTVRNIITHIYSDALNMLFFRVTAEKEIAADINDDACSIARKTVASERIKALVRLSQCVSSQSKFFLECAEKEKEIAFYEEALALEARFMRKSAAFNGIRRGSLERKIRSYSTLFEQEYLRLVGLNNMLVEAGKESEASLRLELAQLSQQLNRLNEDNECLRIELQDRMSVVSKAKAKKDADNIFAGINTLTPIATIAEAMALPDNIKVDVERLQINTQKVRQEVEILKAEIHNLKKQYTLDVALSEDRAKQLRSNQNLLQVRRRRTIDAANTLLRDSEQALINADTVWAEAREAQKAEHWHLVDRLRALRIEFRTLAQTYNRMQQEVQRVRHEGEKLILGGLTPLTFKQN